MLRLPIGVAVLLVIALPSICFAQERIWKDSSGSFSVKAELIKVENGKVHLRRSDNGRIAAVPIIRLCDEDRAYLVEIAKPPTSDEDPKPDNPIPDEPKPDEPKPDVPKADNPKADNPKADNPKSDVPEPKDPETEGGTDPSAPRPGTESPKSDEPVADPVTPTQPMEEPGVIPTEPTEPPKNDSPKFDPTDSDSSAKIPGNPPPFVPPGSKPPTKMDMPVDDAVPSNDSTPGSSSPNAGMTESDDDSSVTGATPIDFSSIFDEKPLTIDPSQLSLKPVPVQSEWVGKTDQQLIDSIDLSAEILWKGNVRLSHLLEPRKPNFEIVITTPGSELMNLATNVGYASFDTVFDSAEGEHQPVRLPPGIPNPVGGWVSVSGNADDQPIKIGIEFTRPAKVPQRLETVNGNLKVLFGVERQSLMVSQIGVTTGRVEHPVLSEEGLDIVIRRPDELTLVVEGSGQVTNLIGMTLVGDIAQVVGETQMSSSRSTYFQFNFLKPIPADLALAIEIVSASRELTVPFSFQDLEFRPGQVQGSVPRR